MLGAQGRLGRMLQQCWPVPSELVLQSRRKGPGIHTFDILAAPNELAKVALKCRAVICLAGVTNVHNARTGDPMRLNTELALATISAAPRGMPVFIASSAAVYGNENGLCREDQNVVPVSEYGHAKREMELAAIALGQKRGVPVTALRIGNVAGADAILGGWSPEMVLDRFPNGMTPARSYIGPFGLARILHLLTCQTGLPDILNIATPGAVEMGALLSQAGLDFGTKDAPPGAIPKVELDVSRLAQWVDFAPDAGTPRALVRDWENWKDRT